MPLDNTTYHGNEGENNRRWGMICQRMKSMLDKFEKYGCRLDKMELKNDDRKVKKHISMMGAGIVEARILAEEGGMIYADRIFKVLAEVKMAKDRVYTELIANRDLFSVMEEIRNHPLTVKARKIYEVGESEIIKILEGKK